ncbi:hypothetical protein GY45DRAFT_1213749, partial [Cubamyces sp. BRFM 1775]
SRVWATPRNRPLHAFHSRDLWGGAEESLSLRRAQREYDPTMDPVRTSNKIGPRLQDALWALRPSLTGHLPGTLLLCEEMPVILKNNEATELGATNGASGVVAGWTAHSDSKGRQFLDVLFVRLCNPPKDVQVSGLPVNVVPVCPLRKTVRCILPVDDITLSIQRDQVPCLPNFAMTDYASQGHTRMKNVIHPKYCQNHQSVYTMLSRSSSLTHTVILGSLNSNKIQGGAAAALIQEYCELELLNEITRLREANKLSHLVSGSSRNALIPSFLRLQPWDYIPPHSDQALDWSAFPRARMASSDGQRTHTPVVDDEVRTKPIVDKIATVRSSKRKRTHVVEQWEVAGVAKAPKLAEMLNARHSLGPKPGILWDAENWSCAYDALFTILYNTHLDVGSSWLHSLDGGDIIAQFAISRLSTPLSPFSSLERVRNEIRDVLNSANSTAFPRYGALPTSVSDICFTLFGTADNFATSTITCQCGSTARRVSDMCRNYLWYVLPQYSLPANQPLTVQHMLDGLLAESFIAHCPACRATCTATTVLLTAPPLLVLDVGSVSFEHSVETIVLLPVDGAMVQYALTGVVYHGYNHFTCRYLDPSGTVWFHDGATSGSSCIRE